MVSSSFVFLFCLLCIGPVHNQLAQKLKEKIKGLSGNAAPDEMMLFPNIGFQRKEGDWRINLHGWRYQPSKRSRFLGESSSSVAQRIARLLASPEQAVYYNDSFNRDRLEPFMVEDRGSERVRIAIGPKHNYSTKTDREGQFRSSFILPNADIQAIKHVEKGNAVINVKAVGDNDDAWEGRVHLLERNGLSVISDIDDTIKISEVVDKIRLVANTFIHKFRVVPGMPEVYRGWKSKYNCSIHYLSAMPDQLYNITKEFIEEHNFPDGTFHMRHFRWASSSIYQFVHSVDTKMHKTNHLRYFVFNTLRSLVLVGDSGERDPEIYGLIARLYPKRIRRIFIRAVKGEKDDDKRFQQAFKDVPREKWLIFRDALKDLPKDLDAVPSSEPAKPTTKKPKKTKG